MASTDEQGDYFIHLTEGKDFSRLLYPNPVCFLCTPSDISSHYYYQDNVMTCSWLTAMNNDGTLVMSINRHRHSAHYMKEVGQEFCLCVPVAGMESLVLAVGATSGKFGSKFLEANDANSSSNIGVDDNHHHHHHHQKEDSPAANQDSTVKSHLSKRQKKRQEREALRNGIPGLVALPFDGSHNEIEPSSKRLFYIQGTVARMRCQIVMVNQNDEIDNGHYIIFARVLDAYCHSGYWDESKKLFCAKEAQRPFLTFFGSQTFGHVVAASTDAIEEGGPL